MNGVAKKFKPFHRKPTFMTFKVDFKKCVGKCWAENGPLNGPKLDYMLCTRIV